METWQQVVALARGLGVTVDNVVPLRSTNNRLGWLAPSQVVAKVSTSPHRAAREVQIARQLAEVSAPSVAPVVDQAFRSPAAR